MGMAFHHHFCALDSINLILSCPWVPGGRTPVLVSWLAKRAGGDTPLRKSPFDVVVTHKFFMALSRFSSGAAILAHASPKKAPINANNMHPYNVGDGTVFSHHVSLTAASGTVEEHSDPIEHDINFLHSNIPASFTMTEPNGHALGSDKSDDEPFTPDTSDYSLCPNDDECFCAPTMDHEHEHASPATEMSCETAAAILADLRRDADMDTIRTWLGCSQVGFNESAECMIKISTVLQMME